MWVITNPRPIIKYTMKTKTLNIAVLGATGSVGQTIIEILEERAFPVGTLYPLASHRSLGATVTFKGESLPVIDAAEFDFAQADIGLFSAGGATSATYAPKATQAGCIVIDNTSLFRYEPDIPLIVPEVNIDKLPLYKKRSIIANPNCSTIQMVVALKPIYDAVGIQCIHVATYQSVSGSGRSGISALEKEVHTLLQGKSVTSTHYSTQIAFNVIPHIDVFEENNYTREEMKMVWETHKLFDDDTIQVNPTAVRVPVFYGHSEAIYIETKEKITAKKACELLRSAPGVILMPDTNYPTPAVEAIASDAVYVGRVREALSNPKGLNMWVVADNVRKGAALNAVQIAEALL